MYVIKAEDLIVNELVDPAHPSQCISRLSIVLIQAYLINQCRKYKIKKDKDTRIEHEYQFDVPYPASLVATLSTSLIVTSTRTRMIQASQLHEVQRQKFIVKKNVPLTSDKREGQSSNYY